MRSATWPRPLATTIGAAEVAGSYLSATAYVVGFVSTTSAVGTASMMRLRKERRSVAARPRTSGSPSDWRSSSLTSWRVILSWVVMS